MADAIAQSMSLEYDARERVCAGLLFVLRHNLQNGHACLPQDKLCGAASGFLGVEPETVASTLAFMLENNDLCAVEYREKAWVYLPEYMRAELSVARHLRWLIKYPCAGGEHRSGAGHHLCAFAAGGNRSGAWRQCSGAHRRAGHR